MCRYSEHNEYKTHWVCFPCKSTFKYDGGWSSPENITGPICPNCGEKMNNLGRDFKAPRKDNINQWKKIKLLFSRGVRFDSCGCTGPGYRPKTYAEAKNKYSGKKFF